jgi:hypothetical protein
MNDVIKGKIKTLIDNKAKFPKALDTVLFIAENIIDVSNLTPEPIQGLRESHR